MGINVNTLRFLLRSKSSGVDYSRTAMIGRQTLNMKWADFRGVLREEFNVQEDDATLEKIYQERYADGVFRMLGAREVHSLDYSDYEGANLVHDLNQPLPEANFGRYTAVLEGGTLEHVFNFPVAIKSCMQMVQVGGHFLGTSPANNFAGHGFFQFSPELYFRIFAPENGYEMVHVFLHEGRTTKRWLKVVDPKEVRRVMRLVNCRPTLMLVLARRVSDVPIFSPPPLQSIYDTLWDGDKEIGSKRRRKPKCMVRRILPKS